MKAFWSEVTLVAVEGGHIPRLDTRPLKTPARADLILPTRALAEAVADEWRAQSGDVNPATMPLTRAANSAIDRVGQAFDAVAAEIAGYGATDLLCYRAPHPQALADRQAAAWEPLLHWAAQTLDAKLATTTGVIPTAQAPDALENLRARVAAHDPWALTALHDLVTLSGSLVLGLAVSHRHVAAPRAWQISRIDEDWNAEEWGEDAEASRQAALKRDAFLQADRLLQLLSNG